MAMISWLQPIHSLIAARISRFNTIDQALKDKLRSSISSDWFEEGIECEFLKASTGGGWQKGKIRVREFSLHLEFVPDVPDEPEPSPDTTALAPLSELLNPDQQ